MSHETAPGSRAKPVVTLFESYGSGASVVGPRVAALLGVPFIGQRFSSDEIERAEAERDARGGLLPRLVRSLSRGAAGVEANAGVIPTDEEHGSVLDNVRELRKAVADGGVVVGRNATVILADHPNALHVKLDGPVEQRVARAAAEAGIDLALAAKRQVREDRVRAEMSLRLHNWDPRQNDRFDLVINTGSIALDKAAEIIAANHRLLATEQ